MTDAPYPEKHQRLLKLAGNLRKQVPGAMAGFGQLHQKSMSDGALPRKTKELMALAISISSLCEGCVAYHVHDALRAGATREEILETLGVALMMGGGPAMIYGCEALEALEQFEARAHGSSAA